MHTGRFAKLTAVAAVTGGLLATTAVAFTPQEIPAHWDVGGVGADGRSLDLFYNAGGCIGPARATAVETPESVTLTVLETDTVPDGPNEACTADYQRRTVRVVLAAPLGGRAIHGRPAVAVPLETVVAAVDKLRVPRLVGFSQWEARRGLRLRHLGVRVRTTRGTGRRAQVVGQAPGAGSLIAQRGTVRLHIVLP